MTHAYLCHKGCYFMKIFQKEEMNETQLTLFEKETSRNTSTNRDLQYLFD
jgi:hypothetical protein